MSLSRRTFLTAGLTAGCALALAGGAAGQTGRRELALIFGGDQIGTQTISVARSGDTLEVDIDIAIAVRVFGLTMYRYSLAARETWQGGRLQSLSARTDDNGTNRFARAVREGEEVVIDGSGFVGRVTGNPVPQSYWNPVFLERGIWISLEDGQPQRIAARQVGAETWQTAEGPVQAVRWRVEGELDPVDLIYDAAGEWIGNEFRARGQTARFVLQTRGPALLPLWQGA